MYNLFIPSQHFYKKKQYLLKCSENYIPLLKKRTAKIQSFSFLHKIKMRIFLINDHLVKERHQSFLAKANLSSFLIQTSLNNAYFLRNLEDAVNQVKANKIIAFNKR